MGKRRRDKGNSGFSVVEMLAAVAILVILMGVGMVGAARYRDVLRLMELDNGAREIFLAAENRAVLLSSARRLEGAVRGSGKNTGVAPAELGVSGAKAEKAAAAELYYVAKSDVVKSIQGSGDSGTLPPLLTVGSIDPTLLDEADSGDFYIVYDLNSGSVTDVFYGEESLAELVDKAGGFAGFYSTWKKSASERLKLKKDAGFLVGHYDGLAAEGAERPPVLLPPAELRVEIRNEEKLTVVVTCRTPDNSPAELDVKLRVDGKTVDLMKITGSGRRTVTGTAANGTYTWVLDSLEKGEDLRFKSLPGLDSSTSLGGDFTVEAALRPVSGAEPTFQEATASDTDNSLFWYQAGSNGDMAYVANLRHLQNLDEDSNVRGKTTAVQIDDILCRNNDTYPEYNFTPIENKDITLYQGKYQNRNYAIRNLYIEGNIWRAGLFSQVQSAMRFEDVRLVNACVKTTHTDGDAGALLGYAEAQVTIKNCQVYWETDDLVRSLEETLGRDEDDKDLYKYQISGASAGGLVGYATSNGPITITNSFAATLVQGTGAAGGLVGSAAGTVTANNSYADCYLKGTSAASGLVGELTTGGSASLTNCYAAGFITGGSRMAGLCAGGGKTTTQNVYTVMRYPKGAASESIFNLTENTADSFDGKNTWYLGSAGLYAKSYADMVGDQFVTEMGGAFAGKTGAESHPYNLREHLRLGIYSYPGLKDLPHYGDWGAEFKEPSLVYYEQYGTGGYGVSGGNARELVRSLEDKESVQSDGYAVAFLRDDYQSDGTNPVKVKYTYCDKEGVERTLERTYDSSQLIPTGWKNEGGDVVQCYLIPLPDDLVNSDYAEDHFYRYIRFELDLGGGNTPKGEYLFNPHFAETVEPLESKENNGVWTGDEITGAIQERLKASMEVLVRTPRHLYDLSQFPEYYHNEARRYTFRQVLDLDYMDYSGYAAEDENGKEVPFIQAKDGAPYRQAPIGSFGKPFTGTYDGGCNEIRNVAPGLKEDSDRRYAGLFGYSAGRLEDIVYAMDPEFQVSVAREKLSGSLYVGALAGGNQGTMYNCAVYGANVSASTSGATLYIGGLVGENDGTIQNCAAEFANLSAVSFNFSTIYIGGLVGENRPDRQITSSYAVGRIATNVDANTTREARICGFVGYNGGRISRSYAAVDLQPGSDKVQVYGFCGTKAGSQEGNGFLDQGNFTYRGTSYAAKYKREDGADGDKAVSYPYADLTADAKAGEFGMGKAAAKDPGNPDPEVDFPYPAVIRDKSGAYTHYGQWPVPMPLGEMGVFY